jgi:protein-S-isoprenylcysteine O-methyltransferase Ste14
MYLAVLLILAGWAVSFQSVAMFLYGSEVALVFHLRVVLVEEPWLAKRHGMQWETYASQVKRWLGRHSCLPSSAA